VIFECKIAEIYFYLKLIAVIFSALNKRNDHAYSIGPGGHVPGYQLDVGLAEQEDR
jgi:hypothetical protein